MSMHAQILWGSLYLSICCLMHVAFLGLTVTLLERFDQRQQHHHHGQQHRLVRITVLLLISFLTIVASHTVQVWLWAWALFGVDQLQTWNASVYFSLVSYTSLGYGDIVLGPGARIFGAMASVTGLLAFGVSTAFLVALMARLLKGWFN